MQPIKACEVSGLRLAAPALWCPLLLPWPDLHSLGPIRRGADPWLDTWVEADTDTGDESDGFSRSDLVP